MNIYHYLRSFEEILHVREMKVIISNYLVPDQRLSLRAHLVKIYNHVP